MSEYFDATQNQIPQGNPAKSEHVNQLRDEVEAGFDLFPTSTALQNNTMTFGVDSGVADAYVVTLPTPPPALGAYAAGMQVAFVPLNTNTGASTINVDGLGVVDILRPDQTALQAGDLTAGRVVELRYISTGDFLFAGGSPPGELVAISDGYQPALTAESDAATSETNAGTSETNAGTSETNAGTSETNAISHASDAAADETTCSDNKAAADAYEADALARRTTSSGWPALTAADLAATLLNETAAGLSASAAQSDETDAATAETNAATSEVAAAASAAETDRLVKAGQNVGSAIGAMKVRGVWEKPASSNITEAYGMAYSPTLDLLVAVSPLSTDIDTTADGRAWTLETGNSGSWFDVVWAGGTINLFVASGIATNFIQTSPDGSTWTVRTAGANNQWERLCYSSTLDRLVAVATTGTGNRIMYSDNGTTWTALTGLTDNQYSAVCWSPDLNLFVALSRSGANRCYTSPDGETWTPRTPPATQEWRDVVWADDLGLFVAIAGGGTGSHTMYSSDGTNWTVGTIASQGWTRVRWIKELGILVALAEDGTNRLSYSTNGINFYSLAALKDTIPWQALEWLPNVKRIIGYASSGGNDEVMLSP